MKDEGVGAGLRMTRHSLNLCLLIPNPCKIHTSASAQTNLCMDPPLPERKTTLLRDPSKLFFQTDNVRRSILGSYWIIILLALPLWWSTTSIQRLSLPTSHVISQAQKHLSIPVTLSLQTDAGSTLVSQLTRSINKHISKAPNRWKGLDIHVNHEPVLGTFISKKSVRVELA
jgi:hypothetical protein